MTKIIVVRHGQTKWNIGQVFRGQADISLNKTGHLQARSLAEFLTDFPLKTVYSSPLSRAQQTAKPIAKKQKLKVEISDLLLDISYGKWQGLSHDKVAKKWPKLFKLWHQAPQKVKFPGGESLADVQKRIKAFLKMVIKKYPEGVIAAVSHRVAIKVLLCTALKLPLSYFWQFQQSTAAFSVLAYQEGLFSLVRLNETCHLKKIKGGIDRVDF